MGALLRLLFMAVFLGLIVTGSFFVVANLIGGIAFNPESRAWKELLNKLRERLKKRGTQPIVPWQGENLTQLSLTPKILKKGGWSDPVFEGLISTIYQEPLAVFAGQKSGRMAVFVAQMADKSLVFRQKEKETEIWVNNLPFAVLSNGHLIAAGKQSRLLAQFESDPDLKQWPLLLGKGEAALLTNLGKTVSPVPRALSVLRALSPEEEEIVLILAMLECFKQVK